MGAGRTRAERTVSAQPGQCRPGSAAPASSLHRRLAPARPAPLAHVPEQPLSTQNARLLDETEPEYLLQRCIRHATTATGHPVARTRLEWEGSTLPAVGAVQPACLHPPLLEKSHPLGLQRRQSSAQYGGTNRRKHHLVQAQR